MKKEMESKRRLVVSAQNLPEELQDELKIKYPDGYSEHMIRIEKGFNDFFYAVTLETEDTSYLVKINVKIDEQQAEGDDKDYYDGDEVVGSDEIIDITEELDSEE